MASSEAIQHHYDIGNPFYELWLDTDMVYSCALWEGSDDTLESAQQRKLDLFIDALDLRPDDRLLDIGCGWGALLRRALDRGRCGTGVGLTLSPSQAEGVRHQVGARPLIVLVESWREHRADRPYDAIVSVGAFEHFAPAGVSPDERQGLYRDFFAACFELLPVDGPLGLQTIVLDDVIEDATSRTGDFFTNTIFPESSVPRLADVVRSFDPWFSLRSLRLDGEHYARTCREWRKRLLARRREAEALVGVDTFRRYSKYLLLAEMQFNTRATDLSRLVLRRRAASLAGSSEATSVPVDAAGRLPAR